MIYYRLPINNDGSTWSAGPFVEAKLSEYTTLRLDGGYDGMTFTQSGSNGDTTNYSGWYAGLTVAQRLNQYWTHSVSIGHEARLGLEVNFYQYAYARYLATWQINPRMTASLDAFIEDANESGGTVTDAERSWRFGTNASVSWRLGNKLSATLSYGYVKKNSNLELRSYYQNVSTIGFKYEF